MSCPVCNSIKYKLISPEVKKLKKCRNCKILFNTEYYPLKYDENYFLNGYKKQYGKTYPEVRTWNVDRAIEALCQAEAITDRESKELLEAHQFQRHVENHYQLMEEWVSREISRESPVLSRLARSLGYSGTESHAVRKSFVSDWEENCRRVRGLVDKYFYGGR